MIFFLVYIKLKSNSKIQAIKVLINPLLYKSPLADLHLNAQNCYSVRILILILNVLSY